MTQLIASYLSGLISFFAPCLLPLFPTYFTVITGFTFSELYGLEFSKIRGRVFASSLFFAAGFVTVFTLLGLTGSLIGQIIGSYMPLLLRFSGAILIVMGLVQLGVIKLDLLRFDYAWKIQHKLTHLGFFTAFATGVAAALSWIPCIGPLLAPILLLAGSSETVIHGGLLLFVFSLGLVSPFIAAGLFFPNVVGKLRSHSASLHRLSQIAGIVLIVFGVILFFDQYRVFLGLFGTNLFDRLYPSAVR